MVSSPAVRGLPDLDASDSNKKHLSTDLMAEEPEREGYLSPEVELLGVQAIGRVCTLCADPVPGVG